MNAMWRGDLATMLSTSTAYQDGSRKCKLAHSAMWFGTSISTEIEYGSSSLKVNSFTIYVCTNSLSIIDIG